MAGFIKENIPEATPIVLNDFRHALCIGETGCGKTTSFMLPNISSRIQENYGMFIVDIKGSLHSHVKAIASKYGRLNDVIEIGVPWGEKINVFENISRSLFLNTLSEINGKEGDKFWITSALNLAGQIYDIFAIAKNLELLLKNKNDLNFKYRFEPKSISMIVSSFSSLNEFILDCTIIRYSLDLEKILELVDHGVSEYDIYLIRQFSKEFESTLEKINDFYKDIDQDSPSSGSGAVLFTLRSLIYLFSQNGLDGKYELKELLEDGKIVILHAETYDENLTSSIINILYNRLLLRNNDKPITLFIDEFQRSVSKRNLPHIDLFREMKVELIASMQNIEQLENKLGKTTCNEFLGNILHNYEYANHRENSLDTFEYEYKNKKSLAKPMFIDEKEKVLAQIKWQNLGKNPLPLGWIYFRPDGYKRMIIVNTQTKETKYHYMLEEKDRLLQNELVKVKENKIISVA
ncbi:TraM recognition domain-containing protein [Candidatus Sulfurimonas baltica]|uniref:TraM recognition domain-containing protein n=1 Tax=Candidatus Sulfurimonas baltica TaxID=2740404 RepID=A0A7S7LXG4_9BACT|nr:TraM recognition domain-containing protein [Candidatus Sulfurimonas baltica]QOY53222.1 TraM recognition domain-containing protein [Candidatus Sulfurimonas baltica]